MYPSSSGPDTQTTGKRSFGTPGAVLAIVGAVMTLLSFTMLTWLSTPDSGLGKSQKFSNLRDLLDQLDKYGGESGVGLSAGDHVRIVYFDWLSWTLLGVAVVVALFAVSPVGRGIFRGLALLIGLIGAGLTLFIPGDSEGSYTKALGEGNIGFWFAVAGFVLLGIGGLIGPGRKAAAWTSGSAPASEAWPAAEVAPVTYSQPYVPIQPAEERPTPVAVASQWGQDPTGRHQMRYYDGSRWTEHVSDNGVASIDPI